MAKIFKLPENFQNKINRNNFDLRHKNYGTYAFGVEYPVLCMPTMPGDSFEIDMALALNMFPLNFPTPTNCRVEVDFFWQPNRNSYDEFDNFLQNVQDGVARELPFISQGVDFYKTGSLADYLGVPSSVVATGEINLSSGFVSNQFGLSSLYPTGNGRRLPDNFTPPMGFTNGTYSSLAQSFWFILLVDMYGHSFKDCVFTTKPVFRGDIREHLRRAYFTLNPFYYAPQLISNHIQFTCSNVTYASGTTTVAIAAFGSHSGVLDNDSVLLHTISCTVSGETLTSVSGEADFIHDIEVFLAESSNNCIFFAIVPLDKDGRSNTSSIKADAIFSYTCNAPDAADISHVPSSFAYYRNSQSSPDSVKISAIPFRVYEAIHNCYYRNQHGVQPFIVNGSPIYNRFNTTLSGGADTTNYHLFRHNWELDAYTSGMPSPQQGNAPVIGLTALNTLTITDKNGITTYKTTMGDSGEIQIVRTSPSASVEHDRLALNAMQGGFTIADFRAGNAFTRFKEISQRVKARYDSFIEGHFGVTPKEVKADYPLFIGGMSTPVNVNMVTSMADANSSLGSFAGQMNAFGGAKHKVRHYCDDFGYIMAIMTIIPEPAYSQILPKHFIRRNPLDFPFDEFSRLGLQPITYQEVAPLQSHLEYSVNSSKKLTDTFCYQRPYHDLVHMPDSVHGQFRTTFKDYFINRLFDGRPELGDDFLSIHKEECNNIFQYRDMDDVCFGSLLFDIKAKRPLPRIVIPTL